MPRPRIMRRVGFQPNITYFKPAGVRLTELEEVILTVDELEALRLKDHKNMEQKHAARKMKISQPTFQRVYDSARKKIADALVKGKALRIEGGNYVFTHRASGRGFGRQGFGFGRSRRRQGRA